MPSRKAAAVAALDDQEFARNTVRETRKGLRRLEAGFAELGLEFVPSQANFILARVGDGKSVFEGRCSGAGSSSGPSRTTDFPSGSA